MQHMASGPGNFVDVHWSVGILFWVVILIGVVMFIKSAFGGRKERPKE